MQLTKMCSAKEEYGGHDRYLPSGSGVRRFVAPGTCLAAACNSLNTVYCTTTSTLPLRVG